MQENECNERNSHSENGRIDSGHRRPMIFEFDDSRLMASGARDE